MVVEKRKRKFLDYYASDYLKPSKYLLLSGDDDSDSGEENTKPKPKAIIGEENQDNYKATKSTSTHTHEITLLEIGSDCLLEIMKFLQIGDDDFVSCMKVCKRFSQLMIPLLEETQLIYETGEHLTSLREHIIESDDLERSQGLFTESATWKVSLLNDEDEEKEDDACWSDHEDVLEHNDCDFQRKLIPFGSPLCQGTIQDQFWLVQDEIDLQSYKQIIEKELGMEEKEQGLYYINPFVFLEKIKHEEGMIDSYINDVQESLHVDCGNPIWISYNYPIYSDEERFNICQIEYPHVTYHALRSGISRLARQAGVLFYEPGIVEDMLYQLKRFIYLIIEDAYETKFPNKTEELQFEESYEQYSRYCIDPDDETLPCFDDDLDTEKKLSEKDIATSFKKLTGKNLFFGKEVDPYDVKNITQIEKSKSDSESESDESSDDEEEDEEEVEFSEEELDSVLPTSEENFIDDTLNVYNFDLDNLGDTLSEQLMKVSIRVHEEIYGKERAHNEKLFLKNWYGNSELFYANCSKQLENPQIIENSQTEEDVIDTEEEEESDSSTPFQNERETIQIDKKEDIEYFGYSLYEDDFDELPILQYDTDKIDNSEQATEEESLQYQLRRMLREQSYECIVNYYEMR